MKKNNTLGIIAILILFIGVINIFILYSPKLNELKIKTEIEKANYCSADFECVDAGGKCPFDCYVYVNKNEVNRISKLINSFESKCVYSCLSCQKATCEDNKCRAVCE